MDTDSALAPGPMILVVEDDPSTLLLVQRFLEEEGFQVRTAADGDEAIRIIASEPPPALALLDFQLPGHNGIELTQRLRQEPGWAAIPVVLLTSNSDDENIVQALQAGANDYILKPFRGRE